MAEKRSVQLEVKLQGAKSIQELEDIIKDINKELKLLDVNSEAFNELNNVSKKANASLKDVKDSLKEVTISAERQLDSISKLGGSLAASFSLASLASSHFSKGTAEDIQKAIKTAQELSVVVSSIKPLLEGVSSANLKAAQAFISNFQKSALSATLFGNSVRAAVSATGIGLLITAIILLAENWDKVTDAIGLTNNAQKKLFEDQQRNIDLANARLEAYNHATQRQIDLLTAQGHKEAEIYDARVEQLKQQLALTKSQLELDNKKFENAKTELSQAIAASTSQNVLVRAYASLTGQVEDAAKEVGELNKKIDSNKEVIAGIDNQLQVLGINEVHRIREAEHAERTRLLNISEQREEITRADADKERAKNQKLQDDLLKQFFDRKKEEVKITIEAQEEIEKVETSTQILGKERELAILETVNLTKKKMDENLRKNLLDGQIQYLEDIKNRTVEQDQVLSDLKIEKFKGQVDEIMPFVTEGLSGINMISQAFTAAFSRQIENLKTQIGVVTTEYQNSIEDRKALEQQLNDSQGTAREQILASIDEERKKEKTLADQRKKLLAEQVKAQNRTNTINWANSLLDSVVQTALATVKALPNVVLATLTGILGGIGTGIIAANKPQPIPIPAAVGGFTGVGKLKDTTGERQAGVYQLHEHEWIASRRMTQDPYYGSIINHLDKIQSATPMATGGFPTPTILPPLNNGGLSVDMIKAIAGSIRPQVSVEAITDATNSVEVIKSKNSF